MKSQKAKLLKEATVKRILRDIRLAEITEDKRHLNERGDYMPCREVCDICGLELP